MSFGILHKVGRIYHFPSSVEMSMTQANLPNAIDGGGFKRILTCMPRTLLEAFWPSQRKWAYSRGRGDRARVTNLRSALKRSNMIGIGT